MGLLRARVRVLRVLAVAPLLLVAAGCASVETAPEEPGPPPPVLGSELASRLGLRHQSLDRQGRVTLSAVDGDSIQIFPDTTVVTVRGARLPVEEAPGRSGDDALLSAEAAAEIEAAWERSRSRAQVWVPVPLPPRPHRGPGGSVTVRSGPEDATPQEREAWSVRVPRRAWQYIVIHHSATDSGSAASFDQAHKAKGWDGLGYDFVIGNGRGTADGAVEVGYRWRQQLRGAHAGDETMNKHGIGICLVGDFSRSRPTAAQMRSLTRLCNFLADYCGIAPENLRLHGDVKQTECPGRNFPRDFAIRRSGGPAAIARH